MVDLSQYMDRVTCGDCLDVLRELPDGCATLAIVDGPYNMRKADWDKFASWPAFAEWYRPLWEQLSRVLRDNCSLYVFGTFQGLAALKPDLDGIGGGWRFVNYIVLHREAIYLKKFDPDKFRSWLPGHYEDCIFYARERVDISALAWWEVCTARKVCPNGVPMQGNTLLEYLESERLRSGTNKLDCNVACGFSPTAGGMASRHYFSASQWQLPTREHYLALRDLFNARGNGSGPYLVRSWDDLRREYEDLRREYEDLRREYEGLRYVFNPQQGVTDVWDVPICAGAERVKAADGTTAHVAQKPLSIMRRIIEASSNEGDTVIEPFAGTGTACVAAATLGRHFIGIEREPEYVAIAEARLADALRKRQPALPLDVAAG